MLGSVAFLAAAISVNHAGYEPLAAKWCSVSNPPSDRFIVQTIDSTLLRRTVMRGRLTRSRSGVDFWEADISGLTTPGDYQVLCLGPDAKEPVLRRLPDDFEGAVSVHFPIRHGVYDCAERLFLQYCRWQRCGSKYGWAGMCHQDEVPLKDAGGRTVRTLDVRGGYHQSCDLRCWHDGVSQSLYQMLRYAEIKSPFWSDGIVDEELRWGCDYFLKVISPEGYVYDAQFAPCGWGPRDYYVAPATLGAQCNVVMLFARASRYFRANDQEYSERLLDAAEKIYSQIETNDFFEKSRPAPAKDLPRGSQPAEICYTGQYRTSSYGFSERCGAALELFRATGRERYAKEARMRGEELLSLQIGSGADSGFYRLDRDSDELGFVKDWSYCHEISGLRIPLELYREFGGMRYRDAAIATAEAYVRDMGANDFRPGKSSSAAVAARRALFLAECGVIFGRRDLLPCAQRSFDWIFGSNPGNSSYIEGVGQNQWQRPVFGQFFPSTPQIPGGILNVWRGEYDMPPATLTLWASAVLSSAFSTAGQDGFVYGMGVHYGLDSSERRKPMAMQIAESGFGFVRTDFYRSRIERTDGTYDFTAYDACVRESEAAGVRILPILRDKTRASPEILERLDDWRRFVEAFVRHYGRRHFPVVEVWNEPNISYFWTEGNADQYGRLLKTTSDAIRSVDPSVKVMFGGTSGVPIDFIRRVYQQVGGGCFDVMNVHLYELKPDNRMIEKINDLRKLMSEFGDAKKPIWITEIGWPTHKAGFAGNHLLLAGMKIANPDRKVWRVALVDVENEPSGAIWASCAALKDILPKGSSAVAVGPKALMQCMADGAIDMVVYPPDETYPVDTIDGVVEFVKNGGVLVEFGGCPMYKAVRPKEHGGIQYLSRDGELGDWRKLRIEYSAHWLDAALPQESNRMYPPKFAVDAGVKDDPNGYVTIRYLTDSNLHPGDVMVPLLAGRDLKGRSCVSAAVYRYADWKGASIICANNDRKLRSILTNDEKTQAAYLARAFGMLTASGVEATCLYEYMGEERDPYYSEHHFGIVHRDHSPKMAFAAMTTFARLRPMESQQIHSSWKRGAVYSPQWIRPDGTVCGMLWSDGEAFAADAVFSDSNVTFYDMLGERISCGRSDCADSWKVSVSGMPVYFSGGRLLSLKSPEGTL